MDSIGYPLIDVGDEVVVICPVNAASNDCLVRQQILRWTLKLALFHFML